MASVVFEVFTVCAAPAQVCVSGAVGDPLDSCEQRWRCGRLADMALPTPGPGIVVKVSDFLPDDAALITVTKFEVWISGDWRRRFGDTWVAVNETQPGGPGLIETQSGTVAAVAGVVTLTTEPLLWNTSTTEANAVGGVLLHYPSAQIDKTVRGLIQYANGDAGPQAVLVGPPPKK